MNLFFVRDTLMRAIERKKTLLALSVLFLFMTILGICLVSSPAVYEYQLSVTDKFMTEICFSDDSVFLIFLSRTAGFSLLLLLVLAGGIHPAALLLPLAVLLYRAFTFGGSLYVFFSFYGLSGGLVVFVLYLPVHLCVDVCLLLAASLSVGRAFGFCFCKNDFLGLLWDFLALLILIVLVCFIEMILLLVLFHPIGNIL